MLLSLSAPRTLLGQQTRPAPLQTLASRARLGHGLRCCCRWCGRSAACTARTDAGEDGAAGTASADGGGWRLDRCPPQGMRRRQRWQQLASAASHSSGTSGSGGIGRRRRRRLSNGRTRLTSASSSSRTMLASTRTSRSSSTEFTDDTGQTYSCMEQFIVAKKAKASNGRRDLSGADPRLRV